LQFILGAGTSSMAFALQPSTVAAVAVAPLDIELLAPFGISRGALEVAANVLVTVELADGTRGYGEAAPFPAYNGETQPLAIGQLEAAANWLPGRDGAQWREIAAEFRARGGASCGSALCALESALLDAVNRQQGVPLWRFFGGAGTELETDMTVTTGTAAEAAAAARAIRARGIRSIKAKVGGAGGTAADLARVAAIHEAAPDSPLVLDGNAGLTRAEAAELVGGLKALGIAPVLLEQWLPKEDLEGMRSLGAESGWLVAADESVSSAADARKVAAARAAGVFNIKLMKAGISEALEVAAVARGAGIGLMIGGNIESILAMTVSACFAAGLGGFGFADLDTPLFLASNPFEGGFSLEGGRISVAHIDAGHGVLPRGLLL
jgi:L-alanine-DL-glutamate epimerase-like enolase superfamily enzyme